MASTRIPPKARPVMRALEHHRVTYRCEHLPTGKTSFFVFLLEPGGRPYCWRTAEAEAFAIGLAHRERELHRRDTRIAELEARAAEAQEMIRFWQERYNDFALPRLAELRSHDRPGPNLSADDGLEDRFDPSDVDL